MAKKSVGSGSVSHLGQVAERSSRRVRKQFAAPFNERRMTGCIGSNGGMSLEENPARLMHAHLEMQKAKYLAGQSKQRTTDCNWPFQLNHVLRLGVVLWSNRPSMRNRKEVV